MSGQQNENEPFGSGGHHWSGSGQQQQQQSNGAPGAFGRSPAPVSGKSFAAPPLSHTHTTGGLAQNAPTSATIFGPTAPSAGTFGSKSGSGSGSGLGLAAPQPLHPAVGQGTVLGRTAPNRGPFGRSSGMSLGQAAQVSGATAAGGFYGLQQPSAARAALFGRYFCFPSCVFKSHILQTKFIHSSFLSQRKQRAPHSPPTFHH